MTFGRELGRGRGAGRVVSGAGTGARNPEEAADITGALNPEEAADMQAEMEAQVDLSRSRWKEATSFHLSASLSHS